ncbi:hypothetical protein D3C81_1483260 [compost metagenome]
MGLQANQAVHDMAAGLLQLARPGDIALFVEACLQFYYYGNLLAGFRSMRERADQR